MYGPAKKGMRLWAHFLPRLVQGFSRASLETRWKMSPSSFAANETRAQEEKKLQGGVLFDPYVGRDYERHGAKLLGRRVMVVGASHYCEHFTLGHGCSKGCPFYGKYRFRDNDDRWFFGKKCERFTKVVVERYRQWFGERNERYWFRTFSRFYNLFFSGDKPSHEDRVWILDHVACTEYVQGAEGKDSKANDARAMSADRNFTELEKSVSLLKPDVLIFWGPRAWREVCRRCGIKDATPDIQCATLGGRRVTLVRIPHPSAYGRGGIDREYFHNQLEDVGVHLVECGNTRCQETKKR